MSLENNKEYSEKRLSKVEKEIKSLDIVESLSNVCIYVCGSYGRMEANSNSDLDLFFIDFDTQIKKKTYKEDDKRTLDNDLKNILRKMKFPEFSNDGEYLKVHSLNKILTELGGRNDDYENFFTTRLLLILESVPLFNKKIYKKIINEIVEAYFRDYPGNENSFRPIFLLNEIIRFWKTLCLNYEYKRNEVDRKGDREIAKHRLKNFKLK